MVLSEWFLYCNSTCAIFEKLLRASSILLEISNKLLMSYNCFIISIVILSPFFSYGIPVVLGANAVNLSPNNPSQIGEITIISSPSNCRNEDLIGYFESEG